MKGTTARFSGGLNKDIDPVQLHDGDYLFALNAQTDSSEGDQGVLSSEMGNKIISAIPKGYVIIGHCYMREGEIALFMVNPDPENGSSQIGIFDITGKYTSHVDFKELNFSVEHPIEAVFRIRRGCERTIYWVEKNGNPPRYYVFDNPHQFKFKDGRWSARQFLIQKSYNYQPKITEVKIVNGGRLEAGSYRVGIQLLGENLNGTEWIMNTGRINIFHSELGLPYREVFGSVNGTEDPLKFGASNKAIKVVVTEIDNSFKYYKLAFIRSISTNGTITDIVTTDNIDISINEFVFNGHNAINKITAAEFSQDNNIYYGANTIEQLENRLVLGNVRRKDINWLRLQYYASRINADCILREIELDNINDTANPKNPICDMGNTGYMPGEIYSFGIVYVFEDGTKSPVYHIPGKPSYVDKNTVFDAGNNVYPMSNDNICESKFYTRKSREFDSWGLDSQGKKLEGSPVRHHRFPRRDELGINLVDISRSPVDVMNSRLRLTIYGLLNVLATEPITIKVDYLHNSEQMSVAYRIYPALYNNNDGVNSKQITVVSNGEYRTGQDHRFVNAKVSYSIGESEFKAIEGELTFGENKSIQLKTADDNNFNDFRNVVVGITKDDRTFKSFHKKVKTKIFGIKFSNIDKPKPYDTNGHECVGYYIVRNERTDQEKTVIDNGVIFPTVNVEEFVAFGVLKPKLVTGDRNNSPWQKLFSQSKGGIDFWRENFKLSYALLFPEYLFFGKRPPAFSRIRQIGSFRSHKIKYGYINYNDVNENQSSLPEGDELKKFQDKNDDAGTSGDKTGINRDGYCLSVFSRDNELNYSQYAEDKILPYADIRSFYYLDALDSQYIGDQNKKLYNLSGNNKSCLMWLRKDFQFFDGKNREGDFFSIPYVAIESDNSSPYSTFEYLPYYSQSDNVLSFINEEDNNIAIYGGDAYIGSVRYVSTMFNRLHVAKRVRKTSVWKYIVGGILILGGAAVTVLTGGAALPALGLAIAGVGTLLVSSGIKQQNIQSVLGSDYSGGLSKCVNDEDFGTWSSRSWGVDGRIPAKPQREHWGDLNTTDSVSRIGSDGPSDDTLMWQADCLSDLYFESSVNIALRNEFYADPTPTFLPSISVDGEPNNSPTGWWGISRVQAQDGQKNFHYLDSVETRRPYNDLERYLLRTLTGFDEKRLDSRTYIGFPLGVYYNVNKDYHANNNLKAFFTLPSSYRYNPCANSYPNRVIWSERSFGETIQDGYTSFLANNYVDIDGSTGDITRLLRYDNILYCFTNEGAWYFPSSLQERANDGVVTFIGTGEFLSVPTKRMIDSDTGMGGGCLHSFSAIKTPHGICYVSYSDKRVYVVQGARLAPLSEAGMSSWFKDNIEIITDEQYFANNNKLYKFRDNTFNNIGTGFTLGYDSYNNRLLVTKNDRFSYSNRNGYIISTDGVNRYIFNDYEDIIDRYVSQGWEYLGVEGIEMRFRKFKTEADTKTIKIKKKRKVQKVVQEPQTIFTQADILVVRYTIVGENRSGGGLDTRTLITSPEGIMDHEVGWYQGRENMHSVQNTDYWSYGGDWHPDRVQGDTRGGTDMFAINIKKLKEDRPDVKYIEWLAAGYWFSNTDARAKLVFTTYKGGTIRTTGSPLFTIEVDNGEVLGTIDYPSAKGIEITNAYNSNSTVELNQMTSFGTFKYDIETGSFFASTPKGMVEIGKDGTGANTILVDKVVYEEEDYFDNVTVNNDKLVPEFMAIRAEPYNEIVTDNSWTLSYSFEKQKWISFHSYMPNSYIFTSNKIFSFIDYDSNIYQHNIKGVYNTYYGQRKEHIVEFVCKTPDLSVAIFDSFSLNTDALRFKNNAFYDARLITFNKAILYNSRQCSGVLELRAKANSQGSDYIYNIASNSSLDNSNIERKEKDWNINEFFDVRINYDTHIWTDYLIDRQRNYFIDKVLNLGSLDYNKHWTELERFRDRYIIIRLIFDDASDVKLTTRMCNSNIITYDR